MKPGSKLPLLGSNQDSPDPESGVLPVTPRGTIQLWPLARRARNLRAHVRHLNPALPPAGAHPKIARVIRSSPNRNVPPTLTLVALVVLLSTSLTGCRDATIALGSSPTVARTNADQILTALAAYFGPVQRDARLAAARPKFAKAALVPSRVFNETSAWSSAQDDSRSLVIAGSGVPGQYHLSLVTSAPTLARPGDYRRDRHLTKLSGSEYEWLAHDDLAIGSVTSADFANAVTALFTAIEHASDSSFRTAYRAELPRTTAALSPLYSMDTIRLTRAASGGTEVHLVIRSHPDSLPPAFSHFAKYLDKYSRPTDTELTAYDDAGHQWWHIRKQEARITLDFGVHDGSLAPLTGAVTRIPDQIHVRVDFSTRAWIFRVGASNAVADVQLVGAPHDKGFIATFTHEPDWQLPPLVERMLRAPLKRPFQEGGITLEEGVHDAPGHETSLSSEYRFVLEESSIMRWLGRLGGSAMSDFQQGAEQEANVFIYQAFEAMRQDLDALSATTAKR